MRTNQQAGPPATLNALASDPEVMCDFILESREYLVAIEQQVLTLEHDPANAQAIHAMFRGFHTIKGLAGFLEFAEIQKVAHEVETVLDRVRSGGLAITTKVIDGILESKDDLARTLLTLERMLPGCKGGELPGTSALLMTTQGRANHEGIDSPATTITADLAALASGLLPAPRDNAPKDEAEVSFLVTVPNVAESKLIKVESYKLDLLIALVKDMRIAQSLLAHDPELAGDAKPHLTRSFSQLSRITGEIQKTVLSMRMVPIGKVFQQMRRLVRTLSRQTGKQVDLELVGEETELDRHLVEEIADPLMHMVRNAIDHGIEYPEERRQSGKNSTARLTLRAGHEAGHVLIQISDDGRGLHRGRILLKAQESGLVDSAAELTDQEVFHLIFVPGFSTVDQVTDVSGRGVGMDVVQKKVQKLCGRIEIQSQQGQGTTFTVKLPQTMASMDGLVVGVGAER